MADVIAPKRKTQRRAPPGATEGRRRFVHFMIRYRVVELSKYQENRLRGRKVGLQGHAQRVQVSNTHKTLLHLEESALQLPQPPVLCR